MLNDEEFHTFVYKAAGYINNYPISYTVRSASDFEFIPLTPNHFVRSKVMSDLAPVNLNTSSFLAKFEKVNEMLDLFWKRLIVELSPHLLAYKKWSGLQRNIRVGDVGVLMDENKRNHFPLVRVEKVFPSKDDNVRKLSLRSGKKTFIRGLDKFSLVLPNNES